MPNIERQGKVWLVDGQAVVTLRQHEILEGVKNEGRDPSEWLESSVWYRAMRKHGIKGSNFWYLCQSEILEMREKEGGEREYRSRFANYTPASPEISKLLREAEKAQHPEVKETQLTAQSTSSAGPPRDKRGRIAWSQPAKLFNPEATEGISGLEWALDLEDKGMTRVGCAKLLGVPVHLLSKVLANVRQRKKPGPTELDRKSSTAAVEVGLKERLERALAVRVELKKQLEARLAEIEQIEAENEALAAQLAELEK